MAEALYALLLVLIANLPFFLVRRKAHILWAVPLAFALALALGIAMEYQSTRQVTPKGMVFYVVFASVFFVAASPAMVVRFLWKG